MSRAFRLLAAVALVTLAGPAHAVLFGVSLNGASSGNAGPSSLYSIDTNTGAGTLIGSIGHAVNALAVDPTTGTLYGATTQWNPGFVGLLEIDPNTGAGAQVGAFAGAPGTIAGLAFDAAGNLFANSITTPDTLVQIDVGSGAVTSIGSTGVSAAGHNFSFDQNGDLILIFETSVPEVYDVDTGTGLASFLGNLTADSGDGGSDFNDATGLLWAPRDTGRTQDSFIRITDLGADTFVDLDTDVEYLNALAFSVPEPSALALGIAAFASALGLRRRP